MLIKFFNIKTKHVILYNMGLMETLNIIYPGTATHLYITYGDGYLPFVTAIPGEW